MQSERMARILFIEVGRSRQSRCVKAFKVRKLKGNRLGVLYQIMSIACNVYQDWGRIQPETG